MARVYFNIESLINEVRQRSCLWDLGDSDYSNKIKKHKAWEEVCDAIIPNWSKCSEREKEEKGIEVQKRWRSIRDCYRREIKLQREDSRLGAAANPRRPYLYFSKLTFLRSSVGRKRISHPNMVDPVILMEMDGTYNLKDENESSADAAAVTQDGDDPLTHEETLGKSQSSHLEATYYDERPMQIFKAENASMSKEDDDEDKLFLMSLIPSIKRLGANDKIGLRIEILKCVHKALTSTSNTDGATT